MGAGTAPGARAVGRATRPGGAALVAVAVLGFAAGVPAPGFAQAAGTFRARLSPVPIDLAMQATVKGAGSVTAVLNGTVLTITGTFEGLRAPATQAQIRRGPRGIRGPVVFDLTASRTTSGTLSGRIDLSASQVADLEAGRLYVQLHSESAPDGNLWGWLLQEKR
jgi:hypothetical protein